MRFVRTVFLQNYIENADEFCARRHSLFLLLNLTFIVKDPAKLNYVRVSKLDEFFRGFLASSSASAVYEYQLRLVRKLRNLGSAYFLVWNVYRSGDMPPRHKLQINDFINTSQINWNLPVANCTLNFPRTDGREALRLLIRRFHGFALAPLYSSQHLRQSSQLRARTWCNPLQSLTLHHMSRCRT